MRDAPENGLEFHSAFRMTLWIKKDFYMHDIIGFAELENFVDQKLKNFSSGMQVRLAFSIAIQAQSDILLIDEVLAVGDAQFQKKCMGKLGSVAKEGRTVLLVSHNIGLMETLCSRGVLLRGNGSKIPGD